MSEQAFPQEGPRTATGQDTQDTPTDRRDGADDSATEGGGQGQSAGQVSEVQRLDEGDSDTPISPSDSTAGYPESETGSPDTQGTGPDAAPPENRRDDENARHAHRHPGQSIDRG